MIRPMEDEHSGVSSQFEDPESLKALLPELERAIQSAMAVSAGKPSGGQPSASPANQGGRLSIVQGGRPWAQQRVLSQLEVVRGVPFYGYNGEEALFVKVCRHSLFPGVIPHDNHR